MSDSHEPARTAGSSRGLINIHVAEIQGAKDNAATVAKHKAEHPELQNPKLSHGCAHFFESHFHPHGEKGHAKHDEKSTCPAIVSFIHNKWVQRFLIFLLIVDVFAVIAELIIDNHRADMELQDMCCDANATATYYVDKTGDDTGNLLIKDINTVYQLGKDYAACPTLYADRLIAHNAHGTGHGAGGHGAGNASAHGAAWSYTNLDWSHDYAACKGTGQSPIDIVTLGTNLSITSVAPHVEILDFKAQYVLGCGGGVVVAVGWMCV
jgi:hypothetical protein